MRNRTPAPAPHGARTAAAGLLCLLAAGCFSAPAYRGPATEHFDGSRFLNVPDAATRGFADVVRWQLDRRPGPWGDWRPSAPGAPPPAAVGGSGLRVTFINHATVLVQMAGLNVLTDPIWSERASPVGWAGPQRVRPPGLRLGDLPPIDIVLLSHNHYDHLDLETLTALADAHPQMLIVTGLGNGALLATRGLHRVVELDWWQSHPVRPNAEVTPGSRGASQFLSDDAFEVVAVPARHSSARGTSDQARTLWVGFVLRSRAGRVYFAGDTAFGPHFEEIRRRLGAPRLAILPIGAYRPRWFMQPIHVSPAQAVAAHRALGASTSVAMHFGTFPLADDGEEEPVGELGRQLLAQRVDERRFWVLDFGEGRMVPDAAPRTLRPLPER